LTGAPLQVVHTADDTVPPSAPKKGQLWAVTQTGAMYWYTGTEWATLRVGNGPRPYRLKIQFGPTIPRVREALLSRGSRGAADFVYVWYMRDNRMLLGFDHWGIGGQLSQPIPIPVAGAHELVVDLDRNNRRVILTLDGTEVLRMYTPVYPAAGQLWLGEDPLEGLDTRPFSGTVVLLPDRKESEE
jgi:hypothetical protein